MKLSSLKKHIEELDAKATGGPWNNKAIGYEVASPNLTVCQMMTPTSFERDIDASFIALSRTALPELLRRLLVAEEALDMVVENDKVALDQLKAMGFEPDMTITNKANAALKTIRGEEE